MSQQERKGLLSAGNGAKEQSPSYQNRRQSQQTPVASSSSAEEWSSNYSSDSSLSENDSEDSSYAPDWEEFVQNDGNLFYIEYEHRQPSNHYSTKVQLNQTSEPNASSSRNQFNRASTRRSKKSGNKLSKLINRKLLTKGDNLQQPLRAGQVSTKVKFSEIKEGKIKEVSVFIDPAQRHKFGRRASVCEAILGVSVSPFPDGKRLMIAGYMPNSLLSQDKIVKIGDRLKAINDEEVTVENVDLILMSFTHTVSIKLTLQRMSGEEQDINQQTTVNRVTRIEDLVVDSREIFHLDDVNEVQMSFSVMYLTMNDLDDNGPEGQDVLFCFPPKEQNCLYTSRGSFLTLNSLLNETFESSPLTTTIQFNNEDYHVIYKGLNQDLLLIAISSRCATLQEAKLKTIELVRCMECLHQSVTTSMLQTQFWQNLFTIMANLYADIKNRPQPQVNFEKVLLEPHYVPLPKEAQLRIDDALNEMAAMDYREWNEEPLKSHREFYIVGSALYFKSLLLSTYLPSVDLLDIESILRSLALPKIIELQCVRDMVIWQEIYPKSVERGLIQNDCIYGIPKGRWFLAVVARNHLMLAVILESRHEAQNVSPADRLCITPSPFYIEEIQDTLEHLRSGGIENLTNTWINCNKRPQIYNNDTSNVANEEVAAAAASSTPTNPIKKTEIISILKRRHNSTENVGEKLNTSSSMGGGSSVNSQTFSDEDPSANQKNDDDDSGDSDWDGFPERSSSGFDMSDMTETLLKEVTDVIPSKLTAGTENVLFHYVQIEVGEGIILSPTCLPLNGTTNLIQSFRKACLLIHSILQNTIRFRYLLAQETSKPNAHRSLVAIKEHGILISVDQENPKTLATETIECWVIGRLFSSPPKELYVCHQADVPQNLVELAFRLSLNSAG